MKTREHTTEIIIHHSVSADTTTVQDITKWHKERGFLNIGYQEVIFKKEGAWDFEEGRDVAAVGAHCYGYNRTSIGICICGNYERDELCTEAFELLAERIAYYRNEYDIPAHRVYFHGEVATTLCPGRNITKIKTELIRESNQISTILVLGKELKL